MIYVFFLITGRRACPCTTRVRVRPSLYCDPMLYSVLLLTAVQYPSNNNCTFGLIMLIHVQVVIMYCISAIYVFDSAAQCYSDSAYSALQ